MSDLIDVKRAMRVAAARTREAAHVALHESAPVAVRDHFLSVFKLRRRQTVAAYCAIRSELDVGPLLDALAARGHPCALPVVPSGRGDLVFRRWQPGDSLVRGVMDLREPAAEQPDVEPDVFLVPLLAFDSNGHRLGYGAGYYDRALAAARAVRKVLAIGIAYSAQELPLVPHGPSDERLDGVATELAARRFAAVEDKKGRRSGR